MQELLLARREEVAYLEQGLHGVPPAPTIEEAHGTSSPPPPPLLVSTHYFYTPLFPDVGIEIAVEINGGATKAQPSGFL